MEVRLASTSDPALTGFNLAVSNAITHYHAFYMIRIPDDANPYAAQGARCRAERSRCGQEAGGPDGEA